MSDWPTTPSDTAPWEDEFRDFDDSVGYPHLDPPQLNDLPTDYIKLARSNGFPWTEDIDYDPRLDESRDNFEGEE